MYTFFCFNTCSNYDDVGHFLCENISPNHAEGSKYVELLPHTIVFPFEWQAQRRLSTVQLHTVLDILKNVWSNLKFWGFLDLWTRKEFRTLLEKYDDGSVFFFQDL